MADKNIKELKALILQKEGNKDIELALIKIIEELQLKVKRLEGKVDEMEEDIDSIDEELEMIGSEINELVMGEGGSIISAVCPYCQSEIEIDLEEINEGDDIKCTYCGKEISLEWDCGPDCDCNNHHHDKE